MAIKILIIFVGGGLGALARYLLSGYASVFGGDIFPAGTLAVNAAGSLAVGFLWAFVEGGAFSPNTRLFIFVGFLGALTTFSTFSLETMSLFKSGETAYALLNMLLNNIISVSFAFIGYELSAVSRYISGRI